MNIKISTFHKINTILFVATFVLSWLGFIRITFPFYACFVYLWLFAGILLGIHKKNSLREPTQKKTRLSPYYKSKRVCVLALLGIVVMIEVMRGAVINLNQIPSQEERLRLTWVAHYILLERLRKLPDDPKWEFEHWLASKTTWWGKRLDAKKFWSNRVLWLDNTAEFEAKRRGRKYPPIPYENPALAEYSDKDTCPHWAFWDLTTGCMRNYYYSSERELKFWNYFQYTHPLRSPDEIKSWLKWPVHIDGWMKNKFIMRDKNEKESSDLSWHLHDANLWGYPPECVSPEAFYWEYVMFKREEYKKFIASRNARYNPPDSHFFRDVHVDHTLITEPLTQEQLDAANAWKVAYLNRLRSENRDESYINAYLETWNLTKEYVFGKDKEQKQP